MRGTEEDELVDGASVSGRLNILPSDKTSHRVGDEVDFVAGAGREDGGDFASEQNRRVYIRISPIVRERKQVHSQNIPIRFKCFDEVVVHMKNRVNQPDAIFLRRTEQSGNNNDQINVFLRQNKRVA